MLTDLAYRELKIEKMKERYNNDEDYREAAIERAKQKSKEPYDNDKDNLNKHKKKLLPE